MPATRPLPRLIALLAAAIALTGLAVADDALKARQTGTLDGHTAAVYSVAYTPDGTRLISGSFDTTAKVWDLTTRKAVKTLEGHTGLILSVAVDPSGKRVATGSLDKSARVWDLPGATTPSKTLAHNAGVDALVLRPDGKAALTAAGKTVNVWDLTTGKSARTLPEATADVEAVAWRADSAQVAAGDRASIIRLFNPLDGASQGLIDQPADTVLGLAYLPSGQGLISAGSDGVARLWNLPVVAPVHTDTKGELFAISSDGSKYAVARGKESLQTRDAVKGNVLSEAKDLPAAPVGIALNASGTRLAAAFGDKSVRIYSAADGKEIRKFDPLPVTVTAIAIRADGGAIAISGEDGTTRVFNVGDGKLIKELKSHKGAVISARFHPTDADRIATSGADNTIKVWSIGKATARDLAGHTAAVVSLAFSGDGKALASSSLDKTVRVWDVEKGTTTATSPAGASPVYSVSLSGDGKQFASLSSDGTATLFDATARPLQSLAGLGKNAKSIGFAPGGKSVLVLGTQDGKSTTAWTPSAGRTFEGHTGPINALAITANGAQLLTASADKTIKVYEVATGKEVRSLAGFGDGVRCVAISKDGQTVAAGGLDRTVRTWNLADGKAKQVYTRVSTINSLAFTPDNKSLIIGQADGTLVALDLAAADPAKAETTAIPGTSPLHAIAVAPDGATVVSAAEDKNARVWTLSAGGPKIFNGHASQVYTVSWSADGNTLVTGGGDASARLWDVTKGSQIRSIEKAHTAAVYAAQMHPKGDLLVTAGDDKLIKYWNPADGKELRKGAGHGATVYCLAFRPGHTQIASGSVDKTVRLWNVADGKEIRVFSGHPDDVYSIAFTPDGKRLASIGYGGNLFVWDVETGKPISQQKIAPGLICFGLAISPDGKHIAVAASDEKTYLFDMP